MPYGPGAAAKSHVLSCSARRTGSKGISTGVVSLAFRGFGELANLQEGDQAEKGGQLGFFCLLILAHFVRYWPHMAKTQVDQGLLEAALIGYQAQLTTITGHIAELKSRLGGTAPAQGAGGPAASTMKPRKMSAAAKRRIAAAQRKRWAEYHRTRGAAPAKKAKKRNMSSAARERIAAATRKRWIAYRADKAAALAAAQKPKKKAAVKKSAVKKTVASAMPKAEQTAAS